MYIECTAACNISCTEACCAPETGITRTRQAGMLDFELFRRVIDEVGPVARPHRLLQLRRSVPAQARRRDVRVHQVAASRTSTSTRARTASRFRRSRRAGSCTRASTRSPSRSTARRRRATSSTGSAAGSTSRSRTCGRWPTKSGAPAATCRSSTGATSSSRGTTATRRWTLARQLAARRSASIASAGRSPTIPEDAFSRRFVPGLAGVRSHPARDLGRQQSGQRDPRRHAAGAIDVAHAGAGPAADRAAAAAR